MGCRNFFFGLAAQTKTIFFIPHYVKISQDPEYHFRIPLSWYETKSIFGEIYFFSVLCVAERTFRVNFHRFVCSSMHLVNYYKNIFKSFEKREKNKILSCFDDFSDFGLQCEF